MAALPIPQPSEDNPILRLLGKAPPLLPAPNPSIVRPTFGSVDGMVKPAPPALPAPSAPNVLDPSSPLGRLGPANQELARLQSTGTGISQIHNPLLRGLATAGDDILRIAAPRVEQMVPGTLGHNQFLQGQQVGRINQDLGQATSQANLNLLNVQPQLKQLGMENQFLKTQGYLQHVNDQGEHYDAQNQNYQDNYRKNLAAAGFAPDESDPTGKTLRPLRYEEMSPQQQAGVDLNSAREEEAEAEAALKKAQNDPSSPAFQLAQKRLAVAQQNASAATMRAQAYMGNYLKGAYNVGANGQPLPGAPQIQDGSGGLTTVGATNAGQATKANANVAKFNDVHGALDSVESAALQLVQSGGQLNSPGVIAALTNGEQKSWTPGFIQNYLKSQNAANLTPAERNYVQSLAAAHENIQALRGAVGSGVSDSQINRLDSMIPGAQTPDLNYLLGQTGQIRATANRLGTGVTQAAGGQRLHSQPAASGTVTMKAPDGTTKAVSADQVQHYKSLGATVVH